MKILLLFFFLSSSLFFFLFFSMKHNSKSIQFVKILNIPNSWSFTVDYSFRFSALCELRLASYGPETVADMLRVLLRVLLRFSHNNCVVVACMVRPHPDNWTRALQTAKRICLGTTCNCEQVEVCFIVFSINLVYSTWRPFSPAENTIAYILYMYNLWM